MNGWRSAGPNGRTSITTGCGVAGGAEDQPGPWSERAPTSEPGQRGNSRPSASGGMPVRAADRCRLLERPNTVCLVLRLRVVRTSAISELAPALEGCGTHRCDAQRRRSPPRARCPPVPPWGSSRPPPFRNRRGATFARRHLPTRALGSVLPASLTPERLPPDRGRLLPGRRDTARYETPLERSTSPAPASRT